MKKILTSFLFFAAVIISYQASAQHIIYTQNFDGSMTLPAGWYATPNSWFNDTTLNNASSGYAGVSGANNISIKDTTATLGNDSLITAPISTIGYNNITLDWGARLSKHYADSGSTISLYWSVNGTTWNSLSYTENPNNSGWYPENDSTPISLPAGAANVASLQLMWVADVHFTPSGTYRIDDVVVAGTSITGISSINADAFANVYVSGNSNINITVGQPLTESLNVEIYDLTGRQVSSTNMNTQTLAIDGRSFSDGMYIVKVSDSNRIMATKIIVR